MKRFLLSIFLFTTTGLVTFASNDYADLTDPGGHLRATNAPLSGNSSFTIELWYSGTSTNQSFARLIGFDGYEFEIAAGHGSLKIYDGTWRTTGATGLDTGWHHIAVTNDNTDMKVYVDGAVVFTKVSANFGFSNKKMYIGSAHDNSEKINGFYDEVRVWDAARDSAQINDFMRKQLLGSETNLIAYYPFNCDLHSDQSSSGNTLVPTGTVALASSDFNLFLDDGALDFDGTDDKAFVPTFITANNDFTIEAQFKTSVTATNQYRRVFGWSNNRLEVAIKGGVLMTYFSGVWKTVGGSGFNDGNWHHLAVTKNDTTIAYYIDGVLIDTKIGTLNLSGNMYVGSPQGSIQTDHHQGMIDEVRVWSVVKDSAEIRASMAKTVSCDATGLLAYYDMNTTTDSVPNLVLGAAALQFSGATGNNNNPQFTVTTGKDSINNTLGIGTTIDELNLSLQGVVIYPNPGLGNFVIDMGETNDNFHVQVIDVVGNLVAEKNYTNKKRVNLDIVNSPAGIYFVSIHSPNTNSRRTIKVIKQ